MSSPRTDRTSVWLRYACTFLAWFDLGWLFTTVTPLWLLPAAASLTVWPRLLAAADMWITARMEGDT